MTFGRFGQRDCLSADADFMHLQTKRPVLGSMQTPQ